MRENRDKQCDLIEYIADMSGCDYISDLHNKDKNRIIARILKEIHPEAYSLEMWIDLSEYLLEKKEAFTTIKEIRENLIHHLENQPV